MKRCQALGAATLLAMMAAGLQAQPQGQPAGEHEGQAGHHRGPPPEALDACKGLQAGADCSFTGRGRTVSGSCFAPEGKPLACRPKDRGERPPGSASAPRR
jgi:hypothetical protein